MNLIKPSSHLRLSLWIVENGRYLYNLADGEPGGSDEDSDLVVGPGVG